MRSRRLGDRPTCCIRRECSVLVGIPAWAAISSTRVDRFPASCGRESCPANSVARKPAIARMASTEDFDSPSRSINHVPRLPKTSSIARERSVKSQAGKRVSRGNAPGRKRAPQVKTRSAIDTSAKRERGPTRKHLAQLRRESSCETMKMRYGLASGIIRQGRLLVSEGACWTQKRSTKAACAREGGSNFDPLAPAPA
jgi:hypothetical protein